MHTETDQEMNGVADQQDRITELEIQLAEAQAAVELQEHEMYQMFRNSVVQVRDGKVAVRSWAASYVTDCFVQHFRESGAVNVVDMTAHRPATIHDPAIDLVITIQKADGKTPLQLLAEVCDGMAKLRAAIKQFDNEFAASATAEGDVKAVDALLAAERSIPVPFFFDNEGRKASKVLE